MGAIRECFEETGILLARRKDDPTQLVSLDVEEREAARKRIHGNQVKFGDWLEAIGGIPDTGQ
jgi:8-oxo-dGTP pyrophosphatase MutT (NUDIX family)